jgi:hypothetical protein
VTEQLGEFRPRKYKFHVLAYFSSLDVTMRPNDRCGWVSGNTTEHFHVAIPAPTDENAVAESPSRTCSLCSYLPRVRHL